MQNKVKYQDFPKKRHGKNWLWDDGRIGGGKGIVESTRADTRRGSSSCSHPGLTSEIVSIAGERKVKHQDPIHKNISHNRKPLGKGREASAMPQEGKKRSEKFARVVSLSAEMGELEYRRASRGA